MFLESIYVAVQSPKGYSQLPFLLRSTNISYTEGTSPQIPHQQGRLQVASSLN